MKHYFLVFILFLSGFGFAQKECTVKGVVRDAETGFPVPAALVTISCQECGDTAKSGKVVVSSDAKGQYEFKKFSCRKTCSSFNVKVIKKDYLDGIQFSSKWNTNVVLDFSLFSTSAKAHVEDKTSDADKSGNHEPVSPASSSKEAPAKTDNSPPSRQGKQETGSMNRNSPSLKMSPAVTILLTNGTSALVMGTDTINRIDVEDYLQGKWVFSGKYAADKSYDSNAYYMQGHFLENQKNGSWMNYFPNGLPKYVVNYQHDHAGGAYELFYPNGAPRSKGFYTPASKQFKGVYEEQYPSGNLFKKMEYDSAGLKNGLQYVYYPDQHMSVMATMKNNLLDGQTLIFLEDGGVYSQRQYSAGTLLKEIVLARDRKIPASTLDTLLLELTQANTDVMRELDGAFKEIDQLSAKNKNFVTERGQEMALALKIIDEQQKQLLIQRKHITKIELENKLQENQISHQRIMAILGSVLTIILLFIIVFVIRTSRQKTKVNRILNVQKTEIEEKSKEITDSLNYAKRIQAAMLPPTETIKKAFPDSFILFHPKDIVSGDFYWFHETRNGYMIAAADCTGHGVPGGFMSMVGSVKLSEAAAATADVSQLLGHVNKGIKKALRQDSSSESTRDGMDITLCYFDREQKYLDYAAANRPLWLIKKSGTEITEIKATKNAIGGFTAHDQEFSKHRINLNTGDTLYLFSDGYADQFGTGNKKLMVKRFKEKLISIQNKNLTEQGKNLEAFFLEWKGDKEQTDDILVMGIRV